MRLPEKVFASLDEFAELCRTHESLWRHGKEQGLLVTGLCEGARESFAAAFYAARGAGQGPALLILPQERYAAAYEAAFAAQGLNVLNYPLREMHFAPMTASLEFEQQRLGVLHAVMQGKADVVITTPDAALQYTMPPSELGTLCRTFSPGDRLTPQSLAAMAAACGYAAADAVDGVGQFARRGGIVDLFAPGAQEPVRIEFFGDEIESIAPFDLITQRRGESIPAFSLSPARELIITPQAKERILAAITAAQKRHKTKHPELFESLTAEAEAVRADAPTVAYDRYLSLIYEENACLLDYFAGQGLLLIAESGACRTRLEGFARQTAESAVVLCEHSGLSGKIMSFAKAGTTLSMYATRHRAVYLDAFQSGAGLSLGGIFHFQTQQCLSYLDAPSLLCTDIAQYRSGGYRIALLCESRTQAHALREVLAQQKITAPDGAQDLSPEKMTAGVPYLVSGIACAGFVLPGEKIALLSMTRRATAQRYRQNRAGMKKGAARSKKSAAERIASYNDLRVGDYVVHEVHGIGKYEGLRSITDIDGATRDFITIRYEGGDALYVPCDQLDLVTKYIGAHADDGTVRLSKMGGTEWAKTKSRVRAATKEMAKELIALYAARRRLAGFAFQKDDDMQRDFEQTFPYEETVGQLQAAQEIKEDMESPVPMERLLCGDVGYGKTEVALRAAFKAVLSGKQVAILCPTTILAMQHFQTIGTRMRGFPVQVDVLSRFRTPAQQQKTLRSVQRGEVDILVGTHRMLSSDVVFHDLGLVIVDEEQRFGVAQKEKLKTMTRGVDVLTLTATPIPRTLHMSMTGIRDMSILEEAPSDRVPVQSYVTEYDAELLAEAVRTELRRGGQVFWLHNRVEDIDLCAARICKAVPQARIATAHGKTDREEMERIWQAMIDGEVDVLVCTTIIETGVDIPNANTLVIENADRMGLSQLHQIRGRIGRSGRRAYAYFTYPRGKVLTEIAAKRLEAIREYTQFGAGFKIAMRDLEIRGAGNVLGAQQHGHMDAVGYDLYIKLLNEAILEERDGTAAKPIEKCTVSMRCDASLPSSYVPSAAERIDLYRRIALIDCTADRADLAQELRDRYGKLPPQAKQLLDISYLRALGTAQGFSKIEQQQSGVLLYPQNDDMAYWIAFMTEVNRAPDTCACMRVGLGNTANLVYVPKKPMRAVEEVISLLHFLEQWNHARGAEAEKTEETQKAEKTE